MEGVIILLCIDDGCCIRRALEESGMLMIQKMPGYVDCRPETNEQTGTGEYYMAVNRLGCK